MDLLLLVNTESGSVDYSLVPDTEDIRDYIFTYGRRKGRQAMLDEINALNAQHASIADANALVEDDLSTLDSTNVRFGVAPFHRPMAAEQHKAYLLSQISSVNSDSALVIVQMAQALGATSVTELVASPRY